MFRSRHWQSQLETCAFRFWAGVMLKRNAGVAQRRNCFRKGLIARRFGRMVARPEKLFQRRLLISLRWNHRGRAQLHGRCKDPGRRLVVWWSRRDETAGAPET